MAQYALVEILDFNKPVRFSLDQSTYQNFEAEIEPYCVKVLEGPADEQERVVKVPEDAIQLACDQDALDLQKRLEESQQSPLVIEVAGCDQPLIFGPEDVVVAGFLRLSLLGKMNDSLGQQMAMENRRLAAEKEESERDKFTVDELKLLLDHASSFFNITQRFSLMPY